MKGEILKLLKESDGYLSGQELCERFGVSRTSVLARISEYIMQETMTAQRSFFTIITIGNASHGNSSNWKIMRTCLKIFIRKKTSNRQQHRYRV